MDALVEPYYDTENSIGKMKQVVHMNGYADVNNEEVKETKREECVVVVVRCRPMAPKEISMGYSQVVEMRPDQGTITIRNPKEDHKDPVKTFTFDAVYDWKSKQHELYDEVVRPLVDSVLNGFNATIFAYGQTGTGKTYTMEGCKNNVVDNNHDDQRGIIPKSFEHIFTHISRTTDKQHLIRASYLEIYQEEVRDLLDKDPKKRYDLRESKDIGVYVKGLQTHICKSVKEIEDVMTIGNKNRTIGATNMNEHSSRSHAIFMITIEMSDLNTKSSKTQIKVGKLNLVDLAGSERQSKTGATGDRLKEASKINLSLSALGNVISALVDGKCQHIPYRDSKLTRLLQDSLGGNSRTLMVANIGPASYNYDETLTTLRYANRAKNIQNQPRVNEDPKDAIIRQYQEEIEKLKSLLNERKRKSVTNEEEQELEERKADILRNDNDISAEEQRRQLNVIEEKQKMLREEKKYSDDLNEKIQSLESKLLQGGKNIIDHTNEQQKALEKHLAEITERKLHDLQMQKRLMELEESTENVRISYTNLLDEVEAKRKHLSRIIAKYQRIKQEIQDSVEEHNENRRELELSQRDILKEIKLRQLIIDNFIPPDEKQNIISRIVYDEDEQNWQVISDSDSSYIKHRLLADDKYRTPKSEYAKRNMHTGNIRFRGENLLDLPLYIPEPTTKEYEKTNETPSLKLMLESALKEEENIDIHVGNKQIIKSRLPKGTGFLRNGKYYPQARGLVPK